MACFQLFAWPGLGHLGKTDTAAKEKKTREERERGKEGRMTEMGGEVERVDAEDKL